MKRKNLMLIFALILGVLAGCNNGTDTSQESEELKMLEVDFEVAEKADVDETVELSAIVTYGDEKVKDADEVTFEYWEQGNKENSTMIEAKNNEDGTYTAQVSFDSDGVYEMYAHTTARDLHTMPKKSITIGEGTSADHEDENHNVEGEHSGHQKGLDMHFMDPENVKVNEEINLTVNLQMDNKPLKDARVQYEIVNDSLDVHEWVETEETVSGEYTNSYLFAKEGNYTIVIHVEDDEGLHEHTEQVLEVNK
ncbi:FixH family protein [Oceanobacillus sp. Castelsardo]|uniref:FixH family protein n=1 Tax=Oceanobacillus sp. Castelsardo TaxID=1851204 RepID=UPI00083916D6|nr:FixH family protein [Oceanobacillus sp. Castelsardo]